MVLSSRSDSSDLACADVPRGDWSHHPWGVGARFPMARCPWTDNDQWLKRNAVDETLLSSPHVIHVIGSHAERVGPQQTVAASRPSPFGRVLGYPTRESSRYPSTLSPTRRCLIKGDPIRMPDPASTLW